MKNKDELTGLLLQDVQQLGLDLMDEGVLNISPLEWDGALGPKEVNIIERLGFLLDAYQASVWYWEVKIPPLFSSLLALTPGYVLENFANQTPTQK